VPSAPQHRPVVGSSKAALTQTQRSVQLQSARGKRNSTDHSDRAEHGCSIYCALELKCHLSNFETHAAGISVTGANSTHFVPLIRSFATD
jgi:hypothetical protein